MEVQRKKSNPVSCCLIIISTVKLSEITAASLNWQGREILKNIQKDRSTASYTFCLCLAHCLNSSSSVAIKILPKGFLSSTTNSSSPILFNARCQVLPSGARGSSRIPSAMGVGWRGWRRLQTPAWLSAQSRGSYGNQFPRLPVLKAVDAQWLVH